MEHDFCRNLVLKIKKNGNYGTSKINKIAIFRYRNKNSQIEWTLHNGHTKLLSYRSDLIEYRSKENNQ